MVSINKNKIATPHGRLAHTKGNKAKLKKYMDRTLFVDHTSPTAVW
jgi:hypothetical protein